MIIVNLIAQKSDILALRRVARKFSVLFTPTVFRKIRVTDTIPSAQALTALAESDLAHLVRELILVRDDTSDINEEPDDEIRRKNGK